MKTSTKIIGAGIVALTGVSLFFLLRKSKGNTNNKIYVDDDPSFGTSVVFNPKSIADTLYEAMKGTGKSVGSAVGFSIGTDKDVVFDILTGVSVAQFGAIIKAFGVKPYNKTTGNQQFLVWQTPTKYGLKTWLKEELPVKDYALLRKKYPKYL
jgi:hypothetical protein